MAAVSGGGFPPTLTLAELRTVLSPEGWLSSTTPAALASHRDALAATILETDREWAPKRFPKDADVDSELAATLIELDIRHLLHGIGTLLTNDPEKALIPKILQETMPGQRFEADHIGIEIFGRLEWYIDALRAHEGLGVQIEDLHIFPSVQVLRALSQHDPHLGAVRIGRLYFENRGHKVNLELFEAEQAWQYTAWRQYHQFGHVALEPERYELWARLRGRHPLSEPVGHTALRIRGWKQVATLHERVLALGETGDNQVGLYSPELDFNPGDMSANTKLIFPSRTAGGDHLRNRILEVVSYGDRRTKPRDSASPEVG